MGNILPFYPPNSQKNQHLKKMKKMPQDIIIIHKCTKNHDHMLYCSQDIVCDRCNCYYSFCDVIVIFHFSFQHLKKMKKTPRGIIILHKCAKNYDQMMYSSWDIIRNRQMDGQTDRWTDGWKKWHTKVGAPTKKLV